MKRIICLLLCVLMCCMLLAGCADDAIGADLEEYEQYRKKDTRQPLVLDFYIVSETTDASAIETVTREINAYLSLKYNTTLDIHYVSAAQYADTIAADVAASGDARADIVLITSEQMFDSLYSENKLVNLERYYQGKTFGRLNSPEVIAEALLNASIAPDGARYVVPNNRVTGEYGYYLVNKEVAEYFYYSELDFEAMRYDAPLMEESLDALSADIMSVYYALAELDSAIASYYPGKTVQLPAFSAPRSFAAEDLESDFSAAEAILALEQAISVDYRAFINAADINAEIAALEAEIATLRLEDAELNASAISVLEAGIAKLENIKAKDSAATAAYNELHSSYESSKATYNAYAATAEYADYLEELAAHYRFHEFKSEYEALVAATDVSAIDSNPAYLTHETIGTDYFDRLAYLDDYVCIDTTPYISRAQAHESSFAIIAQDGAEDANLAHYERCMEIIYDLNTEESFKNLLQYGVANTHYLKVDTYVDAVTGEIFSLDANRKFTDSEGRACVLGADNKIYTVDALNSEGEISEGAVSIGKALLVTTVSHEGLPETYKMAMEYTGSVFNAYYNPYVDTENYWTAELSVSGKLQNKEAEILAGYCSDPFYCAFN